MAPAARWQVKPLLPQLCAVWGGQAVGRHASSTVPRLPAASRSLPTRPHAHAPHAQQAPPPPPPPPQNGYATHANSAIGNGHRNMAYSSPGGAPEAPLPLRCPRAHCLLQLQPCQAGLCRIPRGSGLTRRLPAPPPPPPQSAS
jgi:hypothetical protein